MIVSSLSKAFASRASAEVADSYSSHNATTDQPAAYRADGILYLAPNARFEFLLNLPEAADIGAKVNDAMRHIEKHNPQLAGVLPKTYNLSPALYSRNCSRKSPRFPPPSTTKRLGESTNTSSANSPATPTT